MKRVLAIASGGGHWKQLVFLRDAFEDADVFWVTTIPGLAEQSNVTPTAIVPDANRNEPLRLISCSLRVFLVVARLRPDVVVTTGALPGLIAVVFGRAFGAKTMFIDSIANAEELSMSGRLARKVAHRCLSQWPSVAEKQGVSYEGSVL